MVPSLRSSTRWSWKTLSYKVLGFGIAEGISDSKMFDSSATFEFAEVVQCREAFIGELKDYAGEPMSEAVSRLSQCPIDSPVLVPSRQRDQSDESVVKSHALALSRAGSFDRE
jgi:hypothetical protein